MSYELLQAVREDDIRLVKRLLDNGADISAKNLNKKTPSDIARIRSNNNILKILIEYEVRNEC